MTHRTTKSSIRRHPLKWALTLLTLAAGSTNAALDCNMVTGVCFDKPLTAADAESSFRYIGKMSSQLPTSAPCPNPPGWVPSRLFAGGSGELPARLSRFCLYRYNGPGDPNPGPLLGLVPGQLAQVDPDVLAVSYLGDSSVGQMINVPLRQQFLTQAGRAANLPLVANKVRLSVLDTMPDVPDPLNATVPYSSHGHAIIHLTEELGCNGNIGSCNIDLHTALALPRTCSEPTGCVDTTGGGSFGTPTDMARAMFLEVDDWLASTAPNLVINLSLGWHARYNTVAGGATRVSMQAAMAAIEFASCHGALVIAAAGNNMPGPVPTAGPLFPGGWETLPAPSAATCLTDYGVAGAPSGAGRPLVYAVGAVDETDGRLFGRIGGEPRLVAYGDHSTATDHNTVADPAGTPTTTQTGSSVSAAVVSATAAAAWAYAPGASANALMDDIYQSAKPLGRTAGFCLTAGNCDEVKRVSLCEAVAKVCPASTSGCPTVAQLDCSAPQPTEAILPLDAIIADFPAPTIDFGAPNVITTLRPGCDRNGLQYVLHSFAGTIITDPCPQVQYYGLTETQFQSANGQPGNNVCEDCLVSYASPGTVYLEFAGDLVSQDHVLFCTTSANQALGFSLHSLGNMTPGQKVTVAGIPEDCIANGLFLAAQIFDPANIAADDAISMVAPLIVNTDRDGDGIPAAVDNCLLVANPGQQDTDGDGIGNRCDPDYDASCFIDFSDLALLKANFFMVSPQVDLTGNGFIDFEDLGVMKMMFFGPPGPAASPNDCD